MKSEEKDRYTQKIRAFALALLNELALKHTVSMKERHKSALTNEDELSETGEPDPEQVLYTIDGTPTPLVRFHPVYPHYDSKKPWTGKIEVRVESAFSTRGKTLRGYTWVEKEKPLSPVKMAQMLVTMAEARKAEAVHRRAHNKAIDHWEGVRDDLREKYPSLPRNLMLKVTDTGITLVFSSDNVTTLERVMETLQAAVNLGRIPAAISPDT